MSGLLGRKIGMTSVPGTEGKNLPCTVIEVDPRVATQIKTLEEDGYEAVQLGSQEKKEKHTTQPGMGHSEEVGVAPQGHLAEFKNFKTEYKLSDVIAVDFLEDAGLVDIMGTSKDKGFQSVAERHGFGGAGQTIHGQHNRVRGPGSIGICSYPAKALKGMRMGSQMGNERVTVQNLRVIEVVPKHSLSLVKGSVLGAGGSILLVEK